MKQHQQAHFAHNSSIHTSAASLHTPTSCHQPNEVRIRGDPLISHLCPIALLDGRHELLISNGVKYTLFGWELDLIPCVIKVIT